MDNCENMDIEWDIIILGGGMGGGVMARALTEKGLRVLLVEKGNLKHQRSPANSIVVEEEDPEKRLDSGRLPHKIKGLVDNTEITIWASLGCGVGGSTLLYASALQRMNPSDFEFRTLPCGKKISWPFSYDELKSYYEQSEKMFSVCGTHDPLESDINSNLKKPPEMCEADQLFYKKFKQIGLHPYRLHVGIKYGEGCDECGGKICHSNCKQTAYNCGIIPALKTGKLKILERAEVIKLNASKTKVESVVIKRFGSEYQVRGKVVVLSAGALFTPLILLKSKNEYWPKGLSNDSGLVGKNLMFHATDFIAFWPPRRCSFNGPKKTIAVRDFYYYNGIKLGEFQSSGLSAGYANILYALRLIFDQSAFRKISLIRHMLRMPAYIASKFLGEATVFATILEDNPYPENRVIEDEKESAGMRFVYTTHIELKNRYFLLRRLLREKISNLRSFPLYLGVNLNYGHPSGTCRAGDDPKTSVVNKDCRSHSIENLYVADSSVMPTSGGTNPSLTIAANSLRIADFIGKQLGME